LNSAYLRPLCYLGAGIGLHSRDLSVNVMVAAKPWGAYMGEDKQTKGLSLKTSTIIRHNVNSVFTKAKTTGNYLNSVLALQEARACGCDEALMLDNDGFVTECSAQNFFIVENNRLITPDVSSALPGITRDTVLTFARKLGIVVEQRRMSRDEVYGADEAFITGTAAEITPIHTVDFHTIGNGQRGAITQIMQENYHQAVHGALPEYDDWLTMVR
jgi:branched-chain amino acid aminotransferase